MSSTAPAVRMNKAAALRAKSNQTRKVGSEATKPKPGPVRQEKVRPPTYQDQDAENGSVDGSPDAEEVVDAEEEEEVQADVVTQAVPALAPKKGTPRSKFSGAIAPKKEKAVTIAPHMKVLSLVSEFKPVPSKPAKFIEFIPDLYRLFAMHAAVASLLSPLKAVHKNDPTYNPVFSRLALAYCAVYVILCARKACSKLTYNERKVLKALEEAYDFTVVKIPGPYVLFLSTLGFHIPADKRFDAICPELAIHNKEAKPSNSQLNPLFPHIPALRYLAHVVSQEDMITDKADAKPAGVTAGTATPHYLRWTSDEITLINGNADFDTAQTMFGLDLQKRATRRTDMSPLSANCALAYRFHTRRLDAVKASQSYAGEEIPIHTDGDCPDLLSFFGLKDSVRWIAPIMESLEYEAKFFEGASSLGSIGFETGQNILCVSHFKLKAAAYVADWFSSTQIDDAEGDDEASQHYVCTMMENVSAGDMAIANFTATVVHYDDGDASNPLTNIASVKTPTNMPKSSVHAYSSHVRQYIRNAPNLAHRFRTHIKTEMMLKLDDVL